MKQKKKEEISLRKIEKSNKQQGKKNCPESESVLDVEKKTKHGYMDSLIFRFLIIVHEEKKFEPISFCLLCLLWCCKTTITNGSLNRKTRKKSQWQTHIITKSSLWFAIFLLEMKTKNTQ